MRRERRRAGRAIRKARREHREHLEANPFGTFTFADVGEAMCQAAIAASNAVAVMARAFADAYERAFEPFLAFWRVAVAEREAQQFRDRLAFRALEVGPSARAEVTV